MLLGCIADDFTGATDLANTLTRQGMATLQINGLPDAAAVAEEAVVVALKTRSIPAPAAVEQSLQALRWLQDHGCEKFFFKYCSTFDSTAAGNIGPVAEALLAALESDFTIACPAAPENGRSVYRGHLFVGDRLLSETGMRHHPLNPMTDSDLVRVLARQSKGAVGLLGHEAIDAGPEAAAARIRALRAEGRSLAIADAVTQRHLQDLAMATAELPLITGGSGLALGLPALFRSQGRLGPALPAECPPVGRNAVVLSGSCSEATNAQVAALKASGPSFRLDPRQLAESGGDISALQVWADSHLGTEPILIYSTAPVAELTATQDALGTTRAAELIETAMGKIARHLVNQGLGRLVVAGGETSGAVVSALAVTRLAIGPEIAPGVPWTFAQDRPGLALALKSGNFGGPDFFARAFEVLP